MVYVVSFSVGFGPVPWLMMAEIFPSRIRGPAASLATAFNWTCTFIVTNSFMNLQVNFTDKLKKKITFKKFDFQKAINTHGVFWLFAVILFIFIFFIIFYVPETRGLSLEDIEQFFTGKPVRSAHSPEPPSGRHYRISSIANLKSTPSIIL